MVSFAVGHTHKPKEGRTPMRAIAITEFGGPEALGLMDMPLPEPGPGEVRVKLARAGVNYIDVYMRAGIYKKSDTYKTELPMRLGMEGGGTIDALGAGVEDWRVGQRVAYCLARGSYADHAVVPAWRLVALPDTVDMDRGVALMLQGMTAHYLTHSAYRLDPGDWCLIHAGAGGVGQLVVQLAKRRGAKVIATVGSPEKADIARARGADHTILYKDEDFRERVMAFTDGAGVSVAYDSVGKATLARSIRSLRRRGLCVNFGASSGVVDCVEPLELAEAGSVFFTRPHLADYTAGAEEIAQRAGDLFAALGDGTLDIAIDRHFPLAEAAQAHRVLEGRATRGKLLLDIAD